MEVSNNKNYEFDKFLNIVKSFNGKIFGDIVKYYINNQHNEIDINNLNINIIFDNENIIKRFIRVINLHYEIYKDLLVKKLEKNKITKYYLILPEDTYYNENNKYNKRIININIFDNKNTIINNLYISKFSNNIDINLLAFNNNSLFLIDSPSLFSCKFNKNIFKISFNNIFNRIINKRFSIIIKTLNFENYIENLNECYKLVKNDLIMDDYYNKDISILFKWKNINKKIRLLYSENDKNKLNNNNECIICKNNFNNEDIIINTKCNHNFHWLCNNDTFGLKNWINCNKSCPICRSMDNNFI